MTHQSTTLENQRRLFDIPRDVAYLNCAYNSPLLKSAQKKLEDGVRTKSHPWLRQPDDFFGDAEECRVLAANALGGSPDCYAVIPSASYGISLVARIFEERLCRGDEIVLLHEEFPSNYLPWQRLSEKTDSRLVVAKTPSDQNWTEVVLRAINQATQIVAVPHCNWATGAQLDLIEIGHAARSVGAVIVLEVTQSLGAMPLNIGEIRPDFVVAAGYKWMLSPYGFGLLYASPQWHEARPLEETWLGRVGADNFAELVNYQSRYQAGARRFDMGEKCIPTILPGANAALTQIGEWSVERISSSLAAINQVIADFLLDHGFKLVPAEQRSPHILGVLADQRVTDELIASLFEKNVYVSRRGSALRISPHLHVTENDIDRLFDAMDHLI